MIDRLQALYQQTGVVHDRQRPGRIRVTRLEPIVTLR
jgi:hypothetical protein